MSTAQQLQPLPSPEPSIFATLAAELGFVPGSPVHDPAPTSEVEEVEQVAEVEEVQETGAVLAVVPEAAPDLQPHDEVVDNAQGWADVEVDEDWSTAQGWAAEEWSEQDPEPVAEVEHVDTPVAPSHGVPTRRVPSMPPISRT